jgi:hypothetical protein
LGNFFITFTGVNEYCEEDEIVISMATENNVFHFMDNFMVLIDIFHHEVSILSATVSFGFFSPNG